MRRPLSSGPCAAPAGKRRWLRICGWSCGGVIAAFIVLLSAAYILFMTGIVTVDMARPYVEKALEARIGYGRDVDIGEIVIDRNPEGGMLLRANNIAILDADGDVIATAPQAEVALQDSWLPWLMQPKRIDLVGVKLIVLIDQNGQLAISTDGGSTLRTPAHSQPLSLPPSPAQSAASDPQSAPLDLAAADPVGGVDTPMGLLRFESLAALAANIDRGGLDGANLNEIGLKDGILLVRNEVSGREWTFTDIDLALSRSQKGGISFDVTSGGTDGPWSARATVGTLIDGKRELALEIRDLAPGDLLIAAGKAEADVLASSPLSVDLNATIDQEGLLLSAEGRVAAGAGELQVGPDAEGRMLIDEAELAFSLDTAARAINITSLAIQAGPFDMDLEGRLTMPAKEGDIWRLQTSKARAVFSGGGEHAEKAELLVLDDIVLNLSFDPLTQRAALDKGVLKGPQASLTLDGALELGGPDPALSLNMAGGPMSVTSLKRLWPVVAAPDVREWVYENIISGDVTSTVITLRAPLASIGNKEMPLATEALDIVVAGTNGSFLVMDDVPPVTGAEINLHVTGRTAQVIATGGGMDTPGKRRLNISSGVFDIPDTAPDNPESKIRISVEGPAAAALELASLPALKGAGGGTMLDPSAVGGRISGTAQVSVRLSEDIKPDDVDYVFDAELTDFSAAKAILGQSLENAKVRVFVTPASNIMRGEGKIGGAPLTFEMTRTAKGEETFSMATKLNDAARNKLGLDLASLTGTVGVKVSGTIGAKSTLADVDVDLTDVRLAELIPGWSKPAGRPARLTAKATFSPNGTKLDDLVVTGPGVNIRGTVELDQHASLVRANLPTFQLSDGDKANVKAEKVDGAMKIVVRGEVIEARAFLKELLEAPIAGRPNEPPADIDLDVDIGVVVGNYGETMRKVVLKLSRRNGDLRSFNLAALVGREGAVTGQMIARDNGRPLLRIVTSEAGALLRFINLYGRLYGGDLWIDVDAPRGDGKPQLGVVNMRDFTIRGEPGLDRLVASAPATMRDGRAQPGSTVVFRKLQADFQRSAEQLIIREGAIWGPTIGSTFDGTLDFAKDRVAVRGTYVPAYGLNNLFSRLPVLGYFLGGGPNEGLVGVTYEIVGPLSGPTLRVNPISAVAPGFLRKIFEFRQAPDPTPPAIVPSR